MARPARTNAEWFKHPAAFRNDRRVKAIRARYGAAGYGLLTMLLELLTDAPNTQLCLDEIEIELLAGDLGSSAEEVSGLIQVGEKVGLFVRNEADCLKCPQLDEWLAAVFDKRNRSRNDAEAAKLSQPAAETRVSVTETPQSRVEENRVEKSKIEPLLSVEDAASAAAPAPVEIEVVEPLPESPTPGLRTPGGAADVGTRVEPPLKASRGGKKLLPEPAHFAAFWQAYPRHDDRASALKAFAKLPAADQEAAAARATAWLAARPDIVSARGDFRPHPATWLNKARWLDASPTPPQQSVNPQQHAVNRSYSNATSAAAARLQTPTPDASSPNPWGIPGRGPAAASTATIGG